MCEYVWTIDPQTFLIFAFDNEREWYVITETRLMKCVNPLMITSQSIESHEFFAIISTTYHDTNESQIITQFSYIKKSRL